MQSSFYRVNQSLQKDSGWHSVATLLAAMLLIGAWMLWALFARVTRYESTDNARIEVNGSAYPVQANLSGQVAVSHLVLDKQVRAGDVLVELDARSERLSLEEERTRFATYAPQLAVLQAQVADQNEGRAGERTILGMSIGEAQAKYREAQAQAQLAAGQADRARKLRAEGLIAEADAQKAAAEAESRRAETENLRITIGRLEPELHVRETDRDVKLKQIAGDIARIQAEQETSVAAMQRLEYEIERRNIRASVDGRLSECATLRPGSHINEGEKIGVILPSGRLQVVAEFPPAAAFGKIRPGQRARVKLKGFPWTQYGSVPAEVSRVAGEIRDGQVRVELALMPTADARIPLQHGLPGLVEIEVEHVSPVALLVRSAGRFVGAQ